MIYGYVRVSTAHQNVENGRFEVANFAQKQGFPIEKWVTEQISSQKDLKKRQLSVLLKKVRKGDVIIATEISRLGRNILEIMEILSICLEKECQVWTIKENYKLGIDIPSKVLAVVFGLVAEFERSLISARTKEALARIKAEGKKTWAAKRNTEVYAEIGYVKRKIAKNAWQWGWQKGSWQKAWC
ncbi:MAG: recombinase family protein [Fibromonadaceae bacterium]|jgi:DNA invertase Pin-like site-specific DNA recombinase|nr:recombinase family protein [Fibromonadaceae bacterium]